MRCSKNTLHIVIEIGIVPKQFPQQWQARLKITNPMYSSEAKNLIGIYTL